MYSDKIVTLAIPSEIAGLKGMISEHFGHSPAFTIIRYEPVSNRIQFAEIIQNRPHHHGGCLESVEILISLSVNKLIVGKMGRFAFNDVRQKGIETYYGVPGLVKRNIELFFGNKLSSFSRHPVEFTNFSAGVDF